MIFRFRLYCAYFAVVVLSICAIPKLALADATDPGSEEDQKLKIDQVYTVKILKERMAYVPRKLYVEPGKVIQINFVNENDLPHNFTVIQDGSLARFGKLVDQLIDDPKGEERHYIPDSDDLIAATPMLQQGESHSIVFKTPDSAAILPYFCTFPGHWRMMQGKMYVGHPKPEDKKKKK